MNPRPARSQWVHHGLGVLIFVCAGAIAPVQAQGLFEDRDARLAILDLRKQVEALQSSQAELLASLQRLGQQLQDSNPQQGLLELVQQNQELRKEVNQLRGLIEESQARLKHFENASLADSSPLSQVKRDLNDSKRQISELENEFKTALQSITVRLSKFEPYSVSVNGKRYWISLSESESFNAAMESIKAQDWKAANERLTDWIDRYASNSPYTPTARYWLANSYAALERNEQASDAYAAFVQKHPEDANVPDAMLSLSNSQIALKKSAEAKKTLIALSKRFPKSEAGKAAIRQLKSFK